MEGALNLLIYLIIIVIFLVVLFWILDRFLIMIGGVYIFATSDNNNNNKDKDHDDDDKLSKQLKEYCESIQIENATNNEIICKLKK